MSDYGFVHAGKVFTPDCTSDITPEDNDARNAGIESQELARWTEQPDRMLAYYNTDTDRVTTWRGTVLGIVVDSNVYRHNFGSRMVSMRVRGTNGAIYHGRASWDHGNCIWLRKTKARR